MKYFVRKSRYEGEYMITISKCGYKNAINARKAGQKASKNYIYVEVGEYDEKQENPELHTIDEYEYGELTIRGGKDKWDFLTQVNQQAQEEVQITLSPSTTEN